MADNSTLLENVKKEIRSILITSPNEMSIRSFRQMYHQLIGYDIPFEKLGYTSVEDFLKSIPDAAYVKCLRSGYMVSAVVNEQTRHISDMVSKQKVSRRAPPKNRPHIIKNYYSSYEPIAPRFARKQKFLPATVKKEIEFLLMRYSDGISVHNFPSAFRVTFGKDLNFKHLGFSCLEDCFSCISDLKLKAVDGVLKVYNSHSTSNKVPSLSMQRNPVPSLPASSSFQRPASPLLPRPASPLLQRSESSFLPRPKDPLLPQPESPLLQRQLGGSASYVNVNNVRVRSPVPLVTTIQPSTSMNIEHLDSGTNSPTSSSCLSNNDDGDDEFECSTVSNKMKQNFKTILQKNPQGIWVADFPLHYKKLTGVEFDLHELGYFSMIELTNDLPSIFRKEQPSNCKRDWLLFDAATKPPSPVKLAESDKPMKYDTQKALAKTPPSNDITKSLDEVVCNVKKLLKGFPGGLYLDDFIHQYTLHCDAALYLPGEEAENLEEFLLLIADRVPLKLDHSNARVKACLVQNNTSPLHNKIFAPSCLETFSKSKIPSDAVEPGQIYDWQSIPSRFQSGDLYFKMTFATIVDPSCLWIQMMEDGACQALDRLMDNLEKFYNGPTSKDYIMHMDHITPRMLCAAIWSGDGCWHRVTITDITFCSTIVSVSYVDYGTHGKVDVSNLRYLKKEFLSLPAQAIKARMAFIKPVNGVKWDPAIKGRILDDYSNRILMAAKTPSVCYPGLQSLWICDVAGEEDVFLGKVLIQEGYALHSTDTTEIHYQISPSLSPVSTINSPSFHSPPLHPSSLNPNMTLPFSLNTEESMIKPPSPPQQIKSISTQSMQVPFLQNDCDSDDIFDDDESALEELCAQYAMCKRYVQRIHLKDQLKFHIIVVNESPYVSLGDISLLLWRNDSCDLLYRRSRAKKLSFEAITIQEFDYSDVFYQLRCFNVNGMKNVENMTFIQLFPLNNVIKVLNVFGHPSPTIRHEISLEINKFYLKDDIWKTFSKLNISDGEENQTETDSDKFQRMCIFDLTSALEGLRYKNLKLMREIAKSPSKETVEQLKLEMRGYERQSNIYENRIKEIQSYCS